MILFPMATLTMIQFWYGFTKNSSVNSVVEDVSTVIVNSTSLQIDRMGQNQSQKLANQDRGTTNRPSSLVPHQLEDMYVQSLSIPRRLIFTYKTYILPDHLSSNVNNTVQLYTQQWGQSVETEFLDDGDCREYLRRVEPRLVAHFNAERHGMYKADICRIAALYEIGGYYFDVDIQVIDPPTFDAPVTFATIHEPVGLNTGFFQAFLASVPGHPVLRAALDAMLDYYELRTRPKYKMGTITLKYAYNKVLPDTSTVAFFQETELQSSLHNVSEQHGVGCCCNYLVEDETHHVYFRSRIVGTQHCKFPRLETRA